MEKIQSQSEEIFDILLRDALIAKYNDEADRFCKLSDEFESTKIFEKNIIKIRHSVNREKRIKFFLKFIKNAAIVTVSVTSLIFAGLMTQPAVYAAVENVIKEKFDTHDSYLYHGEKTEFEKGKRLGYIPDDYEFVSETYYDADANLYYASDDGKTIIFEYGLAVNTKISIDNERHDLSEFNISGTDYYFYEAKEENSFSTLLWYSDGYYYSIDAQLSVGEFIKIAKNIK